MPIHSIQIEGYRSLVRIGLRLGNVTVVTGPNGSGKSNLYRALKLMQRAAVGEFARALSEEGGMPSALWSGKPRASAKRREIVLTVRTEVLNFSLSAGLMPHDPDPLKDGSKFKLDPDIKEELLWSGPVPRPSNTLMQRKRARVTLVDRDGRKQSLSDSLEPGESVLSQVRDPENYPELSLFQQRLSEWRFYHQFRCDASAPMRMPQVGTRSPVLDHDGTKLAAALQTLYESGHGEALESILEEAFPQSTLLIDENAGRFSVALSVPSLRRPLEAHELSDGTLRFLCLAAALLSPRSPELLVLNEPESSLNENLLGPLARLIGEASRGSQIWVTTHSSQLLQAIQREAPTAVVELTMVNGETKVKGKEKVVFESWDDEDAS